jgi:predicted AlkP superfamily pyrophosphatase or phosphodiesterase
MKSSRWTLTTLITSTVVGCLLVVLMFSRGSWLRPPEPDPDMGFGTEQSPPSLPEGPPRLAVLLVFDQLRADYLTRWNSLFEEGGFHRLEREGVWFQNCHYPYAVTVTGPGHASLATGCSPDRHGIVSNQWYDRKTGKTVYCAADTRQSPIPISSPHWLLTQTLGDHLKKETRNTGRVVSLSVKDRSACLLGGQKPDACYWMDNRTGQFVTSIAYRDRPHAWIEEFNKSHPADRFFANDWTHFLPQLDYVYWTTRPDDDDGEWRGKIGNGRVFPHSLKAGQAKPGPAYYEELSYSPFGNDLLFDLVKHAVVAEELGRRETLDLLCVSFSCNDYVGHRWGPDSHEVLDTTLRTDHLLKELLDFLDNRVGKGRYTIALSADHGVCPLPEIKPPAGETGRHRIPVVNLKAQAEAFLARAFPGPDGLAVDELIVEQTPVFYLNRNWMKARGLTPAEAESALGGWLCQRPETLTFYTRTRLENGIPAADVLGQRVRRSFYKERSGDVYLITRPYCLLDLGPMSGTSHGTPHDYDTHVPLLVTGPGVLKNRQVTDPITPQAAAPILARALSLSSLPDAEVPVPDGVFR